MRFLLLLTVILLFSCENKREIIAHRQQDIRKKMEQVKSAFFKKADSLENIKETDSSLAKRLEISYELVSIDKEKSATLKQLFKEYDSLEIELKK